MAYGTSKVITEYISIGEPYINVKKVYSINIVYFDLGQGEDYVYHGKNDFIGIHKADKLKLSPRQIEYLGGKTEPSEIFPEYFVIKVNNFDDVARDSLDQWIYYLKNNEIKDDFNAKGIGKAKELWRVDTLPEEERKKYLKHIDNLHYKASMAWSLKMDAEYEVRKNEALAIAKKLKDKGVDITVIQEVTGLSIEDL